MADVSVMKNALRHVEYGDEVAIATITKAEGSAPRGVGTSMAVLNDGSIYGTIGGGPLEKYIIELAIQAIDKGKSQSFDLPLNKEGVEMICGGAVEVFIDVYKSRPKLLMVGGGHVGYAMYELANLMDFEVVIFEDREEFVTVERFPNAYELLLGPVDKSLKDYKIDENSYIVIATRGHKMDEEALASVVRSNAKYIGAIGSIKKTNTIMENLKEKGFTEEELNKVYAPIGIDIASEKPSEIAVSIMAE
ncbi:MAG TPA: XdhC/CoxI family protein, partial [Tissierellaceae bacterium]|nr:XdhC/CoxI family protein [Tissierellaceae bacterium]